MNGEIRRLLRDADPGTDPESWEWERVLLARNRGPVLRASAERHLPDDRFGFDLVLLGPASEPRFYCKLRPADDHKLKRETEILESFSRDPEVGGTVPRTRGVSSDRIRVQLTAFQDGPPLIQILPELPVHRWEPILAELLELGERLSLRAPALLPALSPGTDPIPLIEEARPGLEHLARAGLLEGEGILREILHGAGSFEPRLQHGDFWPGNVVSSRAGWRAIDFEDFGRVRVPLYDALHMLRTSDTLRRKALAEGSWIDHLAQGDTDATAVKRLLRGAAERAGLEGPAVSGALVYYLVELTRSFHRRWAPRSYWEPLVRELGRVRLMVRSGRSLEEILLNC